MRISQVKTTKYLLPVQFAVADKNYCNERVYSVHCTLFICLRIKTLRKTSEHLKVNNKKNKSNLFLLLWKSFLGVYSLNQEKQIYFWVNSMKKHLKTCLLMFNFSCFSDRASTYFTLKLDFCFGWNVCCLFFETIIVVNSGSCRHCR